MNIIIAVFTLNENIKGVGKRTVGTVVVTREVAKLPVKYTWLENEAKKELDERYELGNLQSICNTTGLIDFSAKE